jgi:hypothetical protein
MTWKYVGASVIGTSHVKIGKPCQDSHAITVSGEECLIGVVADGLGSAEYSDAGSKLAADSVIEYLTHELDLIPPHSNDDWQDLLQRAFVLARKNLEKEAQTRACELRELGTTLIVFTAFPGGIAIAQIGDGAVVVQSDEGTLTTYSSPQRGEYANETVPLTMDNALERVRYSVQATSIRNIAAFSDGLQNLALITSTYEPFEPFFTPLFNFIKSSAELSAIEEKIKTFLGSEKICGKTDDDKTLLLAAWQTETPVETETKVAAPVQETKVEPENKDETAGDTEKPE